MFSGLSPLNHTYIFAFLFSYKVAQLLVTEGEQVQPKQVIAILENRDRLLAAREQAKKQGCTILMVTHDNRILDIADRIVHMSDGYLISNTSSLCE